MKTGKSIQELAQELDRQNSVKKDYLADTRKLRLSDEGQLIMTNGSDHSLVTNENFHRQVAAKLQIPKPYYDRMRKDEPKLLAENVNTWFSNNPTKNMIRTLDGTARAFLSERYRPLDNYELAQAVIPVLTEMNADLRSMEITENKFYLKAVIPGKIEQIAPAGVNINDLKFDGSQRDKHIFVDEVEPGIIISNSEVGDGGLNVWQGLHTRRCTNLATFRGEGFKKHHIGGALGKALQDGEGFKIYFQDDTRKARDVALWKELRDYCRAVCDGELFTQLVDKLRESRGQKIEGDVPKVIEVAGEKFGLLQNEQKGILQHLIEGGELSKYGLSNAVTQYSQNAEVNYDRASELEQMGADIITLPRNDWNNIAVAA